MKRTAWTRCARVGVCFSSLFVFTGCEPEAPPVAKRAGASSAAPAFTKLIKPGQPLGVAEPELPRVEEAKIEEAAKAPAISRAFSGPAIAENVEAEAAPIAACLEASELSRLFQEADSEGMERLLGQRVELTGYVLQVRSLGQQRLVVLGDEHFTTDLPADRVLCHIEKDAASAIHIASPRLKVTGKCQLGYGNLVVLRECTIEEELPALAGFEERKRAFKESRLAEGLKKYGIALEGNPGELEAKLSRRHFQGGRVAPEIVEILRSIPDLRVLRFSGLPLTDQGLRELPFLSRLHEIALDSTRVSTVGLAALVNARELRRITLDGTTMNDGFAQLANCRKLESLELKANQGASQFSDDAALHLAAITGLKRLNLDGAKIGPAVIDWIASQTKLESLSLEYTSLNGAMIHRLGDLRHLQSLSLSGAELDDATMIDFPAIESLADLDLSNTQVTDAGISALSRQTNLRHLNASNCRIVGGGLAALNGLNLETLSLWGSQADNEALIAIESFKGLRRLRLGHTRITYQGLVRLADLEKLEALELTGIRLSKETLPILEGLVSLRELRLSENPFDDCDACLAQLTAARPGMSLFLGHYDYLAQANPGR